MPPRSPLVLFHAAAGPRRGFGHLVRCGVLADALGVGRQISMRASRTTMQTAVRLGWTVHSGRPARLVSQLDPDLVVLDDPSAQDAARWVRQARRLGIPVASIHDLGLARVDSDLAIDGSIATHRGVRSADVQGPAFAILNPMVAALRSRPPAREPHSVLIALGGGENARILGVRLAQRISRKAPRATIQIAVGFCADGALTAALPDRCAWLHAPGGLAQALATASVAVVAGGVTLYEACALGTPVVTLALVAAQLPTVRSFASAGAAIEVTGRSRQQRLNRAAAEVTATLARPERVRAQSRRARALVDGQGTARVARLLLTLMGGSSAEQVRHVA